MLIFLINLQSQPRSGVGMLRPISVWDDFTVSRLIVQALNKRRDMYRSNESDHMMFLASD